LAYIGNIPAESYASFETETFSVSATANYTLSHAVTNETKVDFQQQKYLILLVLMQASTNYTVTIPRNQAGKYHFVLFTSYGSCELQASTTFRDWSIN
jgi:hypothetical protein